MSRRRKRGIESSQPKKDAPSSSQPNAPQGNTSNGLSRLSTRRNLLKAGVAAAVGCLGFGVWSLSRKRDATVFDETTGSADKMVDCYLQFHHGTELALLVQRRPNILGQYLQHQQGILRRLMAQQDADPTTLYLLEGCNPYMQRQMRENHIFTRAVHRTGEMLEQDADGARERMLSAVRTATVQEIVELLATTGASPQFVLRKKYSRTRVFGTEPNEDEFTMLSTFILNEIEALRGLRRQGRITEEALSQAAARINARQVEEMRVRHSYVRDLLRNELLVGQTANIVLGAAHFRSGASVALSQPIDDPIEDYLSQVPNTRVRVTMEAHMPDLKAAITSNARNVQQLDAKTMRMLVEREG